MAEILPHLGCMKPQKQWDKLPINWCGFQPSTAGYRINHQPYPPLPDSTHKTGKLSVMCFLKNLVASVQIEKVPASLCVTPSSKKCYSPTLRRANLTGKKIHNRSRCIQKCRLLCSFEISAQKTYPVVCHINSI